MNARRLTEMKRKVTEARRARDAAEGVMEATRKTLRDKFGCDTDDAARRKVRQLETKRKNLQAEIRKGIEDLEDNYEWDK